MRMDERAINKVTNAMVELLDNLIRIADEENYDRSSFVRAIAEMFYLMTEISTFKEYAPKDGE